jgi:acetyl esterase/lipase
MKQLLSAAVLSLACAAALAAGQVPGAPPADALPGPFRGAPPEADTSWIERQFHNIAYGQSPAQQLDVYLPDAAAGAGPYPVVIAIHGGAFLFGDKADMQLNAPLQSVRRGFAVVSLNYRMSGEAPFPAAVQDVKAAVRFLRAHAAEFHLDRRMMIAWGDSAGGNLAAMLGTTGETRQFDEPASRNGDQSSTVQGVIDWYGPIYFDLMDAQFERSGKGRADHGGADSPESRYLGGALAGMPAQVKAASPATYATAAIPPFLIQQGTQDQTVPVEQSVMFATALRRLAGRDRVELSLLPGARHGGPEFETAENMEKVFAFLARVSGAAKKP